MGTRLPDCPGSLTAAPHRQCTAEIQRWTEAVQVAVKIQFRRGLASEWTSADPLLSEGEIGLELDTGKWKIGDGVTSWNSLGYASQNTIAGVDGLQAALDEKAPLTIPDSLLYSGPRRIPSLTEPIGVVLVQTGGGAGVWDRVDLDGNPVACPPGYFSSRSEYSLNTSAIDNQCMVEIKKFHYANVVLSEGPYAGKRARFINKTAFSGSQAHPAFYNASGVGINQFYVGAYEGYDDGGSKVGSTNNKAPLVSINFTTMLDRCAARNTGGVTGFQLIDIYQLAAIQYLALVEMGNPDAQVSLGRGNCDATYGGSAMQTGTTTAIWRALHELWGNVWMMVQGIENRDGVLWVWNKDGTRAFVNTGFTLPDGGWVVDMSVAAGATFDLGALFIPGETAAASDSGSWSDYFWITKDGTTKVCYHGGSWKHGPSNGLFALNLNYAATLVDTSIGGRLAKV